MAVNTRKSSIRVYAKKMKPCLLYLSVQANRFYQTARIMLDLGRFHIQSAFTPCCRGPPLENLKHIPIFKFSEVRNELGKAQ